MLHGNNLDLEGNELQNAKLHNLPTGSIPAPSATTESQFGYDTSLTQPYWLTSAAKELIYPSRTANVANTTALRDNNGDITVRRVNGALYATADCDLGGFKFTNSANIGSGDSNSTLVNKGYVDSVATGLVVKETARVATTVALVGAYNAGTKRFTMTANGAASIDGVALALNNRVLLKNQGTGSQNGIYFVYQVGDAGTPAIYERATDFDTSAEAEPGAFVFISEGTVNGNSQWVHTTDDPIVLDTTALVWAQFGGVGTFSEGNGIVKVGTTFHFAQSAAYTQHTIPVATSGTTIGFIAAGTANQVMRIPGAGGAPAFGSIDISVAASVGTSLLRVVNGGTNLATIAQGGIIYAASTTAYGCTAASTAGWFVRSGGTGAPTFLDLFGSANMWTGFNTWTLAANANALMLECDARVAAGISSSSVLLLRGKGYTTVNNNFDCALRSVPTANDAATGELWVGAGAYTFKFANSGLFTGSNILLNTSLGTIGAAGVTLTKNARGSAGIDPSPEIWLEAQCYNVSAVQARAKVWMTSANNAGTLGEMHVEVGTGGYDYTLTQAGQLKAASIRLTSLATLGTMLSFAADGTQTAIAPGAQGRILTMGAASVISWELVNLASTSTVTGILPSGNGGTGNGFTKFAGPATSEKTYTLPNASNTVAVIKEFILPATAAGVDCNIDITSMGLTSNSYIVEIYDYVNGNKARVNFEVEHISNVQIRTRRSRVAIPANTFKMVVSGY